MPFGRIHDPIGSGALRCLAVSEHAIGAGRVREFVLAAGRAIWSEAVDVSGDPGLQLVCERAGLAWDECAAAIGDERVLERVQENTDELVALGHWGVPVFLFEGEMYWGQDRIDDLERELRSVGLEW
jgi:2-hydroxychromene-2-carboxylate isomerase